MVETNIAIRVDASTEIGTGHFMRCLTLADALKSRGARIRFISHHMPESLRGVLVEKEYEFVSITSSPTEVINDGLAHAHWLATSQRADAQDSILALSDQIWDWMVVDHYALDARWESALRQTAKNILVIDDIADRPHDCDVLLDQNYYLDAETRYDRFAPVGCRKLLGPDFTLLRNEFSAARSSLRKRDGDIRRILVFFGGCDLGNETLKALKAIQKLDQRGIATDVVIGTHNQHRNDLEEFASALECVSTHFQVSNMAELIAAADLYVGAAGTTTWERCCLGLPSLVVTVATNQVQATRDLDQLGVLTYVGQADSVTTEQITMAIEECMSSPVRMIEQAEKGLALVDGRGALRCAQAILYSTECNSS